MALVGGTTIASTVFRFAPYLALTLSAHALRANKPTPSFLRVLAYGERRSHGKLASSYYFRVKGERVGLRVERRNHQTPM
jgi:hypothetical protein